MKRMFVIEYIDANGFVCEKQEEGEYEHKAWKSFMTNREYANVLSIKPVSDK